MVYGLRAVHDSGALWRLRFFWHHLRGADWERGAGCYWSTGQALWSHRNTFVARMEEELLCRQEDHLEGRGGQRSRRHGSLVFAGPRRPTQQRREKEVCGVPPAAVRVIALPGRGGVLIGNF